MHDEPEEALRVRAVAEAHDADVLLLAGSIDHDSALRVYEVVARREPTRRKNLCLILTTLGGDADAAYRIARCLQRAYSRFTVLLDGYCKSAGTLIVIGAHEIVMSDRAELGPLDTQIQKNDEIGEMTSGLTAIHAFETLQNATSDAFVKTLLDVRLQTGFQISTKTAAELAAPMVIGLFSPIYARLDPMLIGEHARAMTIAQVYGQRLAANLRPNGLERLTARYPTHAFVIDREEACEIFRCVSEPSGGELDLLRTLRPRVMAHHRTDLLVEYLEEHDVPEELHDAPAQPTDADTIPVDEPRDD